jgi:hypothetical protein
VFSWSYCALGTDAARLFRLLGLHPGPDITIAAAASLAGIPAEQARVLLAELARAHLLAEYRPGRYAFHDLLRAYATEQALAHDDASWNAAVGRILDHLLHTGYAAAAVIEPYFATIDPVPPRPGVTVDGPATGEDALEWFTAERATLLAAVRLAAKTGFATYSWQLTWAMTTFLLRRGLWSDQATACEAALDAARRAGDTVGEAHALLLLASAMRGLADSTTPSPVPPRPAAAGDDRRLFEQPGDRPQRPHLDRGAAETPHRHAQPLPASP